MQTLPMDVVEGGIMGFLHPIEAIVLQNTVFPSHSVARDAMVWLRLKRNPIDDIVKSGDQSLLRLTKYVGGLKGTVHALDTAASNGRLDMVAWLHVHRQDGATVLAVDRAACNGHHGVVEWLLQHRREGFTLNALLGAIRNKHIHVLALLLHKHALPTPHVQKAYHYAWTLGDIEAADIIQRFLPSAHTPTPLG